MRYTLRNLRGVLFVFLVIGVFGYFLLMWLGVPMVGSKAVDLIDPSSGRPIRATDARRAELIETDQKASTEYQQAHRGQDAPFSP